MTELEHDGLTPSVASAWAAWRDNKIAKTCSVSDRLVGELRNPIIEPFDDMRTMATTAAPRAPSTAWISAVEKKTRLATKADAKFWMIENQLGKRNTSDFARVAQAQATDQAARPRAPSNIDRGRRTPASSEFGQSWRTHG